MAKDLQTDFVTSFFVLGGAQGQKKLHTKPLCKVVSYSIFTGNNVEIFLKPGEMVLYESAVVPHGRQFPLNGEYFDNLFVHYALEDGNIYKK